MVVSPMLHLRRWSTAERAIASSCSCRECLQGTEEQTRESKLEMR